jgi:hypothetical protein
MTKKTSELLTDDGDAGAGASTAVELFALLDAAPGTGTCCGMPSSSSFLPCF